jgi:Ser/Thr protein kinase RdoA (MazF antagonist)
MIERSVPLILAHWEKRVGAITAWEPMDDTGMVVRAVGQSGSAFVLKELVYPDRLGGIEEQFRVLHYLLERSIPVAVPIESDAGHHSVVSGGHTYTLSPYLPGGTHIAPEDLKRAHRNMGTAIADLHQALAEYPLAIHSWTMNLTDRILEQAVPTIRKHLDDKAKRRLDEALNRAETSMLSAFSGLPVQYIHGDCHGGNILLLAGDVSGFLDLDHLPMGPRVYDLAYLLADMVKRKIGDSAQTAQWFRLAGILIAGYEQVGRLTVGEQESLWAVMLGVQLLFVEFFSEHGHVTEAELNLEAFFWLLQREEEIVRRFQTDHL